MMDAKAIMNAGWKFLAPKFGDMSNALMNQAMEIGQRTNSPAAVIDLCKGMAKSGGMDRELGKIEHILDSFSGRQTNEVVPHGMNLLKEHNKLGSLIKFLFGGNENGR